MNLNSPITARLTPDGRRPPRDEVTIVRADITRGLPHRIDIAPQGLRLYLTVATGQFRSLMKMPPETQVSHGATQQQADAEPDIAPIADFKDLQARKAAQTRVALGQSRARACPRLVFVNDGKFVGQCPAVLGQCILIPAAPRLPNSAGTWIEVTGLSIKAGALVGGGSTSSWIELGWRDIRAGSATFDSRVLRPGLAERLFYVRTDVSGSRQIVPVAAALSSDDADVRAQAGGINWRLSHDRL